jgi:hypothetical protein
MSPELVDEAILAHCKPQFRKVAKVIYYVAADRIKALVEAERLEGAGNLDRWGSSEVRLPEKNASVAVAEASRRHAATDQET